MDVTTFASEGMYVVTALDVTAIFVPVCILLRRKDISQMRYIKFYLYEFIPIWDI